MDSLVNPNIINKIQKLLEHHEGCLKINSEEEAISALEIAKKLMKKHHLDMMMFSEKVTNEGIVHKQLDKCSVYAVPVWLCNIINIVNNLCNCSCVLQKDPQPNGYIHINIVFVSLSVDMNKVDSMYSFLKKTTYRLANKHIKDIHGNYTNWRSFSEGFSSRLLEKSRLFSTTYKDFDGFDKPHDAKTFDENDFEESEIDDVYDEDDDFEEFEEFDDIHRSKKNTVNTNELQVVHTEQKTDIELLNYLKNVKKKIADYINKNMKNVNYQNVNKKSKVNINSYEIGRSQAENINLNPVTDKKLLLTTNKRKKQ